MAEVLFEQKGNVGLITLKRPKALNALTYEMVVAISAQLKAWQTDEAIGAVVVQSSSVKVFCAGGDVRYLYEHGRQTPAVPLQFFNAEYHLNCAIRDYPKPYICLLDGLTMGGGVGLSLHGRFPIATEHFSFAMPETGIGFFPDVGGGYLLSRCPHAYGQYLALTGTRISREDAMEAGLIHYAIASEDTTHFLEALIAQRWQNDAFSQMETLLSNFQQQQVLISTLAQHRQMITDVFSQPSVEAICLALEQETSPWAQQTLALLKAKSPTSLKVTLEQLKRSRGLSMQDTMQLEYRLAARFMQGKDFYEGVRALLIDKDKSPHWQPDMLADIDGDDVEAYFEPLARELFD